MRYVNGLFCIVMILFAAVQYNDPDFMLWGAIYAAAAVWAGFAAWRPQRLRAALPSVALALSLLLAVAGTVHYWPSDADWWRQEVWWQSETAREGMGIMAVLTTLLLVALTWLLQRRAGGSRRPIDVPE